MGHWHNDMPGLTKDATIIAYLQREFTKDVVELLISASKRELAALTDHPFVQPPGVLRANEYDLMNQKLFGFLDKLVMAYSGKR